MLPRPLVVGIDASNLRGGGGVTHLIELLNAADPHACGFGSVVVWAGRRTHERLPQRSWIQAYHVAQLDRSLPFRLYWQRRHLDREAERRGCDLLFVPGGTYQGHYRPVVTMSRNLLPFDPVARSSFGFSRMRLKLALLQRAQSRTFRSASGVIFLTQTARSVVERTTGHLTARVAIIPHGVSTLARGEPPFGDVSDGWSQERPFKLLYVSTVDMYKNQDKVVNAIARLRGEGLHVRLTLVGSAYPPALRRLHRALGAVDPHGQFISYVGEAPYAELHRHYQAADAFVFASLCENLPNILLEAMASALPIACSDRSVMPEVLGEAGVYFDADAPDSIAAAIRRLYVDSELRRRCATLGHERARQYSWERCARETFSFLNTVWTTAPTRSYLPRPNGLSEQHEWKQA